MEQCKLPKAVLDKVPAIESHWHDPLEAAEQIIHGMPNPPGVRRAGSKAFYNSAVTVSPFPRANSSYRPRKKRPPDSTSTRIMPTSGLCRVFYADRSGSWGAGERCRHNQSPSRNASKSSSGRYRPGDDRYGLGLRHRFFLHLDIGMDIHLSAFDGLMAQPERDHGAVHAVLEQLHGRAVTQHVGRYALALKRRAVSAANSTCLRTMRSTASRLSRSPRLLTNSGSHRRRRVH